MGFKPAVRPDPADAGASLTLDNYGNPVVIETLIKTLTENAHKAGAGTASKLSRMLGIPIPSFHRVMRDSAEFRAAVVDIRGTADDKVEASLYDRAVGYTATEVRKTEGLDKNGMRVESETVVEKEIAPDVGAAKFWLINRRPDDWAERQEVEVTGGYRDHLIKDMGDVIENDA